MADLRKLNLKIKVLFIIKVIFILLFINLSYVSWYEYDDLSEKVFEEIKDLSRKKKDREEKEKEIEKIKEERKKDKNFQKEN